ncbi:cyclin-like protein [Ramaria rubella]|nr:cyclin-like protein [Ramaria rubella]
MTALASSIPQYDPIANQTAPRQSLYEGSSQYSHWRFSPEQLEATRSSLNAAAVKAIRDAFETDTPGSSNSVSFLNHNEEYALMKLYVGKVAQRNHFRFPEEVEATAVSYLKRFYLQNTVMDWHPKNVMLTALFLAAKTTNTPISLDDYTSHIPKTVPADVLDLEFLVAQSLGFEFSVWHAHRALWGLRLDLQTLPDAASDPKLDDLYNDALQNVRASRLTDAEFIYTPSQIALGSLALASSALAEQWATSKGQGEILFTILPTIQELIIKGGVGPEVEVVREVDRRLRICKNPEKVKGSKAWLKKQEEAEEAAKEKRVRKAEEARKAMEADDPFGGHLVEQGEPRIDFDDDDD